MSLLVLEGANNVEVMMNIGQSHNYLLLVMIEL
jgi:hypothetical protein